VDEFVGSNLCRVCDTKGYGRRSVVVSLQGGWTVPESRLPEMRVPSDDELAQGYRGDIWIASKGDWKIEVVWRGDQGKFLCRSVHADEPDNPRESRTFDYPHEVVDWIGVWSTQLVRAR
jgi:hypothetical protein